VIGRLVADDVRFIANTVNDTQTLSRMLAEEMLERVGKVTTGAAAEGANLFQFL